MKKLVMDIESYVNVAISAAIEAGKVILDIYKAQSYDIDQKSDFSPITRADLQANEIITNKLKPTDLPILSEEGENIPYQKRKNWELFWLVDPLDGTKEFIKRNGEFTVNIALVKNNTPIAGIIYIPVTAEIFTAIVTEGTFKLTTENDRITFQEIKTEGKKLPVERNNNVYKITSSRSHKNEETNRFIETIQEKHKDVEIVYTGSSIKFCRLAEGAADIYPRFAPTMEWDTAAGHAILKACGKNIWTTDHLSELTYNKPDLKNPFFIAE